MKRIMVVDDKPDQIFTVKTALGYVDSEYEIIGANSGEECIEMLNNGTIPDLILSETKMYGMSGRELSDQLKENPAWQDVPVMFLTVWKDSFVNTSDYSDDEYIEKPFNMMDLKKKIDTVLKKE